MWAKVASSKSRRLGLDWVVPFRAAVAAAWVQAPEAAQAVTDIITVDGLLPGMKDNIYSNPSADAISAGQ